MRWHVLRIVNVQLVVVEAAIVAAAAVCCAVRPWLAAGTLEAGMRLLFGDNAIHAKKLDDEGQLLSCHLGPGLRHAVRRRGGPGKAHLEGHVLVGRSGFRYWVQGGHFAGCPISKRSSQTYKSAYPCPF